MNIIKNEDSGNGSNEDWKSYRRVVVEDIKRLQDWCGDLQKDINDIQVRLAVSNIKVAMLATGITLVINAVVIALIKEFVASLLLK